jgi:hypothetical protein
LAAISSYLLQIMSPRLGSLFFFASWALLLCSRVVDAVTTFNLFQYAPSGGLFGINGTDRATCTPIKPLTNAICAYQKIASKFTAIRFLCHESLVALGLLLRTLPCPQSRSLNLAAIFSLNSQSASCFVFLLSARSPQLSTMRGALASMARAPAT